MLAEAAAFPRTRLALLAQVLWGCGPRWCFWLCLSAVVEKLLLLLPVRRYRCVCSLRIQDLELGDAVSFAGSKAGNKDTSYSCGLVGSALVLKDSVCGFCF